MGLEYPHQPVLVQEVLDSLLTARDGLYVDGTVGTGGHSEKIAMLTGRKARLICLDRDPEAIDISRQRLASFKNKVTFVQQSYAALDRVLSDLSIERVHGILLDLGVSSYQLEHCGRGFSFNRDEPLDMRMDPRDKVTARQLVNRLGRKELEDIIRRYGEERRARRIAKAIENTRKRGPISSSVQLANLIRSIVPRSHGPGAKDPATRTFQALRIAVNRELENLESFLSKCPELLLKGGRLVILTYHSLEDRMVKKAMVDWERGCTCPPDLPVCKCGKAPLFRRLSRKGIKPSREEIEKNPRARSAMLRAAERI